MGLDAETPMAIEVVGAVDVFAANPPPDMSPEALDAARRRKINDIVIVLEKQAAELSDAISTRIRPHLPEGETANVTLGFDLKEPTFVARLPLSEPLENTQRRELGAVLVETVKAEFAGRISTAASRIGIWEPVVTAEFVGKASTVRMATTGNAVKTRWWLIATIAAALGIAAIYILAGR